MAYTKSKVLNDLSPASSSMISTPIASSDGDSASPGPLPPLFFFYNPSPLAVAAVSATRLCAGDAAVFDSCRALVGASSTPRGLHIAQVGADSLIGVWRDGPQVEYVRVHAIRKK
jgi:hypothetical protein